jgi:ABC-2 type transport system ATP-binding protein
MANRKQPVVIVDNVVKSFRIPLEGSTGLKQKLINSLKGRKGYRVFTPLNGVSFEVNKGDFFGIVGKNGSGKSTLLKTLAGIYTPQGGQVSVKGSLVPFIELGVGFNPELSGRENVYLNGALLGFSHPEVDAMYDEIVHFAELEDFMEERLKNYSSGMQVRLAFSIAIKAKADILLLDEVLAVGDAAFQQKCFDYFEELKRQGQTVIIVTHDMNAVRRFCNKAMIISKGEIEMIGSPEEVAELYTEENIEKRVDPEHVEETISYMDVDIITNKRQFKQDDQIKLSVKCSNLEDEAFVNTSFVSNGFVIADRNSKLNPASDQVSNDVTFEFTQDLKNFNAGKYDIHLSLHRKKDSHLLEHKPRVFSFIIKGHDPSRDGPMRLDGVWTQLEQKKSVEKNDVK